MGSTPSFPTPAALQTPRPQTPAPVVGAATAPQPVAPQTIPQQAAFPFPYWSPQANTTTAPSLAQLTQMANQKSRDQLSLTRQTETQHPPAAINTLPVTPIASVSNAPVIKSAAPLRKATAPTPQMIANTGPASSYNRFDAKAQRVQPDKKKTHPVLTVLAGLAATAGVGFLAYKGVKNWNSSAIPATVSDPVRETTLAIANKIRSYFDIPHADLAEDARQAYQSLYTDLPEMTADKMEEVFHGLGITTGSSRQALIDSAKAKATLAYAASQASDETAKQAIEAAHANMAQYQRALFSHSVASMGDTTKTSAIIGSSREPIGTASLEHLASLLNATHLPEGALPSQLYSTPHYTIRHLYETLPQAELPTQALRDLRQLVRRSTREARAKHALAFREHLDHAIRSKAFEQAQAFQEQASSDAAKDAWQQVLERLSGQSSVSSRVGSLWQRTKQRLGLG